MEEKEIQLKKKTFFLNLQCKKNNNPATDWQPVWTVPRLLPDDSWDRLQPHCDPVFDKQKKMDGWLVYKKTRVVHFT